MKKLLLVLFSLLTFNLCKAQLDIIPQFGGFTNFDYNHGIGGGIELSYQPHKHYAMSLGVNSYVTFDDKDIKWAIPLLIKYYPSKYVNIHTGYDFIGQIPFGVELNYKKLYVAIRYSINPSILEKSFLSIGIGYKINYLTDKK